ncbi:hypothetical protein [Actinacidiphila oryziradicis]|uniref:Uncharacterized protein n=1 Tax=Actinacidiphila oryziradicis TaxID=2571141 RepID=A0A4U0SNP9_9ACTN|nr:hypothetical protein [Actinacidiphila oryziradicis]TKA01985.1 hypothetical protein FCI23_39635 [Actinacidiphila oryziradicis]
MTDRMERWMQTGSGGAMVATGPESAESRARAKLMERYTLYTAHDSACRQCATADARCDIGATLYESWRQARDSGHARRP